MDETDVERLQKKRFEDDGVYALCGMLPKEIKG